MNQYKTNKERADLEVKVDGIDRILMLARVVLHGASEKALGEVESADPEDSRYALLDPGGDER